MAIGIGDVYVNVLPNMEGFSEEVASSVAEATEAASADAAAGASEAAGTAAEETATSIGERLKESFSTIGSLAGILFAGAFVMKAIDAYESVEKAQAQLEFGLEKLGQGNQLDNIVDWANEVSLKTGQSTASILTMAGKLTGLGQTFFESVGPKAASYIEDLTQAMMDLAAATGKPAAGLMRSLAPNILNAPDKASKSLLKMGQLTQEQVDHTLELVAADDKLGATQFILNTLLEENAGAAAALVTPMELIHNDFTMLAANVGKMLNPVLETFANLLLSLPIGLQTVAFMVVGLGGVVAKLVSALGGWSEVKNFANSLALFSTWLKVTKLEVIENIAANGGYMASFIGLGETIQIATLYMVEWIAANAAWLLIAGIALIAIAAVVSGMMSIHKTEAEVADVTDQAAASLSRLGDATQQYQVLQEKLAAETANNNPWHMISEGLAAALPGTKTSAEHIADAQANLVDMSIEHNQRLAESIGETVGLSAEGIEGIKKFWDGGAAAFAGTTDELDNFVAQLSGAKGISDVQKMTIAQLTDGYINATGGVDGLNMALIRSKIAAGEGDEAQRILQAAIDKTGVSVHTVANDLDVLSGVTGQSADALQNGLITAMETLGEDDGAALAKWTAATEGQIRQWADDIANTLMDSNDSWNNAINDLSASGVKSAADASDSFANLQDDAHTTATAIIKDSQNYARDSAKASGAYSKITKRAGQDSAQTLQFMSDHGITSLKALNEVAGMSKKEWRQFQTSVHKSTRAATNDMESLGDKAKREAQDATRTAKLFDKVTAKAGDNATSLMNHLRDNGQLTAENLKRLNGMSSKELDKMADRFKRTEDATAHVSDAADDLANKSLADVISQVAEAQGALEDLDSVGVHITVTDDMATSQAAADKLLRTLIAIDNKDPNAGPEGGGQAEGGPVAKGTQYLVGERGPELFTPDRNGYIIPNHKLQGDLDAVERIGGGGGGRTTSRKERTPLRLVLDDGTELGAYLEEIVHDTVGGR